MADSPSSEHHSLVVVSTSLRPGADYLPQTLDSLDAAGACNEDKVVLSDGPLRPGWICPWPSQVNQLVGCSRANLWRAFKLAVERKANRLLFFEDDIQPCQDAVRTMRDAAIDEDLFLLSFYDRREIEEGASPGIYRLPAVRTRGFWSTVAVAFPLRSCTYLAAKDSAAVFAGHRHLADQVVGRLMADSPWPMFGIHVPCLVRHVGELSLTHGTRLDLGPRQTRNCRP